MSSLELAAAAARLADDARILLALLRGRGTRGSHAERLDAFYGPQAERYDAFRERLLNGRSELMARLAVPAGAHVVELGAGTGRNLLYLEAMSGGPGIDALARADLVDLCPSLLTVARRRFAGRPNVHVIEADACRWRPGVPVDRVYLSYALTMIPDWRAAIDNAIAMLRPGGRLGVVDFYVSAAKPAPGLAPHGRFTRAFWPRWFAHDGVQLDGERLALLRERLPDHELLERRAPVPYMLGLRVPYYLFVGSP
jgi:S-adenosylmethionine-diacylgycerolhomoserine-N-methlytransferase